MPQGMPMQQPQMGAGGMGGMPGVPQSMMPPQAPMAMPPQLGMPNIPQSAPGQNPMIAQYMQVCARLLPSVTEKNPYLKEKVGEAIFPTIR